MNKLNEDNNWYLRSLHKIADSVGQVKLNRTDSVKKAIYESFDIKLSTEDSRKVLSILSQDIHKKDRANFINEKISEFLETDEETTFKIASYLTNFKN